ncbi:hypothetical protein O3M35_012061 [Rhynocoris fuscipes]|uniref:Cytochrome P450 n=1 Tax=Rhynocoris fuscipes TaxID=488301 RepID=A0AAW1CV00_9HEMI
MVLLTLSLGAIITLLLSIYWYLSRNKNYWESKGVPCRKPVFLFGNIKDRMLLKISAHDFVQQYYNEMKGKPYAGIYEGSRPILFIIDPEIIKLVLVKHFDHFHDRQTIRFKPDGVTENIMIALKGAVWKKTRVACSPAFSSGRLKAMVPLLIDSGEQMVQYLNNVTEKSGATELDIRKFLINYTLNSVASSSFGLNLNTYADPNSEFVRKGLAFQDVPIYIRILTLICLICEIPEWITTKLPLTLFNNDTKSIFGKTVAETTMYRMKNNVRRNDLLQILIDAQKAPVEDIGETHEDLTNEKREVLERQLAMAQSVFFFVAGFETTSSSLSMACYELAKNKDVQKRAREEILKHWPEDSRLTYEAVMSMSYLEMVFSEALRLYPPISGLERAVTKPIELNGLNLEVGTKIVIPVSGLHYDPQYYPDPLVFKPERFSHEEKIKRNPYVYLPFGAGPRNCLGLRFALINSLICLSHLLKHYEIDICEKTPIPFVPEERAFFLKSKNDIYLKLTKIDS